MVGQNIAVNDEHGSRSTGVALLSTLYHHPGVKQTPRNENEYAE